jgi:hypothetical protein
MRIIEGKGNKTGTSAMLALTAGGLLLLMLCVFFLSPGTSAFARGRADPAGASESVLASLLARKNLGSADPEEARKAADILAHKSAARGRIPERSMAALFPSASEILAMLARDRDVDDYLENAEEDGAGGTYYQHVVDLVPSMKPLRPQYEGLFLGAYSALKDMGKLKLPPDYPSGGTSYPGGVTLPGQSSRPRMRDLDLSHSFALDIFFRDVWKSPLTGLERGPVVLALEGGIVVAASSSWTGGEELSTYRSGGIAPKAGNGVIVYSPRSRRYYLYFHFHDVFLKAGDAIVAGQPLGHGGNTGTNARKPGHGEHLHLEIFAVTEGRFLRNTEILSLVFD